MRNLVPLELHPKAILIQGRFKPLFMAEGLDESFDACVLVGYHGGPGSRYGVLNHAFHPYELRCHGQVWTETGLTAMVAGHFGVPTVAITGDRAAIREAEPQVPGIRGIVVKEGISRIAGASLHPEEARRRIKAGVREALGRRGDIAPLRVKTPLRFEIDAYFSVQADAMALCPTVERLGDRTIAFTSPDAVTAYHTFLATNYLNRQFA
jgi:D-amino peptidase